MSGLRDSAERAALALLRRTDPERAHGIALRLAATAHRMGLEGPGRPVTSSRLAGRVWNLDFPNPIGIAAGFALEPGPGSAGISVALPPRAT